jgi:hypothetical protein
MFKTISLVFLVLLLAIIVNPVYANPDLKETADPLELFSDATDDELIVFAIPSYYRLNWSSAKNLLVSTGKSYTKPYKGEHSKRAIGHVFIMLRSSSIDSPILTGMAPEDSEENKELLIKHGYGLGVLGADNLGTFEEAEKLAYEGITRLKMGTVAYMRFLLSPSTSKRLVQFYREYEQQGQNLHYGGANRPRYGEGGGCSAFGVSFIDVAGLMKDEYAKNWMVNINIPLKFYGGPLTGNKISFGKFVGQNIFKSRWAKADEPHIAFSIWDPTLINKWINATYEKESSNPSGQYTIEMSGKAKGLIFDGRNIATPEEPMFFDPADSPNTYGRQGGLYHGCDDQ